MQLELKFKSIAMRWFVNVFLIMAVVVTAVAIIFSVVYVNIYNDRIYTLADDYASEFSALSSSNKAGFYNSAVSIATSFLHKDKIEVQVIDADGDVIVTTTGFQSPDEKMPDYERAMNSPNGTGTFSGKNSSGEEIMAGCTIIMGPDGERLGAYRWITSMKIANRKSLMFIVFVFLVAVAVLTLSGTSAMYFIKSIVRPIHDVSNAARKIAMGDFKARIDIAKNDEIGELCDTINYMANELDRSESIKNDFISSVSHELRTPLTAIRGWGETAMMSLGADDELVKRGLEVVLSESERLSGLVEDLLDFSRMETGRLTVDEREVDVTRLLEEASNMYTELSRQQGIDLIFAHSPEQVTVLGDPNRLKQVFINIIDNAVKYTENGGQVLIEQTLEEGCVRISVKDTGVGIPKQDIDRVKEKFYKANKTVRGSGIGLAVADEIIKQHNGLLFIESDEGVGTKVVIVLPLYEPVTEEPMVELLPDGATNEIIQMENEEGGEEAAGEVEDNG